MITHEMTLASNLSLDGIEFAVGRSAFLGIPEAGKTYTAMKTAEQLLTANIPITVFDPVGIWPFLRMNTNGRKGFDVLVFGDAITNPDVLMDEHTIEDDVRICLENHTSIILNFFGNRNKSLWRRVVTKTCDVHLVHNSKYGVRMMYVEEAAEFIPQSAKGTGMEVVKSAIEAVGRMGGNSSLGMGLVNQRAAEIAKSVLELSERMFLHQQTGRNDLKALRDGFRVMQYPDEWVRSVMKDLPALGKGEVFYCEKNREPLRIKILPKMTYHPNRRDPKVAPNIIWTTGQNVANAKMLIEKNRQKGVSVPVAGPPAKAQEKSMFAGSLEKMKEMETTIERMRTRETELVKELSDERAKTGSLIKLKTQLRKALEPLYSPMKQLFDWTEEAVQSGTIQDAGKYAIWRDKLNSGENYMLDQFIKQGRFNSEQLRIAMGKNRETVRLYCGKLVRAGIVKKEGNDWVLI